MNPPATALEIRGLEKRFDRPAVDGLDLTVREGEFYALLGPNGAGKTTTLRIVAGLLRPDAGSVSVFGIDALGDPVEAKKLIAWVSDEPMIYDKLTPLENSSPGSVPPAKGPHRAARAWRIWNSSPGSGAWTRPPPNAKRAGLSSASALALMPMSAARAFKGCTRAAAADPGRAPDRPGCRLGPPSEESADGIGA